MYTRGAEPIRVIVALYSMILNGYAPYQVFVFGEHQWDQRARDLFTETAPFAEIVSTEQVMKHVRGLGGRQLAEMARKHWFVMKALVTLMYAGEECCLMGDDVFILDGVDDALSALQFGDLIFAPDLDRSKSYLQTWPWIHPVPHLPRTGTFNAALYWIRGVVDPRTIADYALRSQPSVTDPHLWEQGLIAMLYAYRNTQHLPCHRYFYPRATVPARCPPQSAEAWYPRFERATIARNGMPAGVLGYDYAENPCGFASINITALAEEFSDAEALQLAPAILGRCRTSNPPLGLEKVRKSLWRIVQGPEG